jgi:hypothetical protein
MEKNPFKFAHRTTDWTQAAQSCMHQLGAIPSGDAGIPVCDASQAARRDPGFFKVRRRGALDELRGRGSRHRRQYLDEPAMALMLGSSRRTISVCCRCCAPQDIEAQPSDAYFARCGGRRMAASGTDRGPSARGQWFVVGGLSSSHGVQADQHDVTRGELSGAVQRAGQAGHPADAGVSPLARARITTASKNIIGSLDHRPALDVMKEEIGEVLARDLRRAAGYIFVGLPVQGSDTGDYLVRNILGVDPQNNLVAVGETVEPGDELLFCRRDQQTAEDDLSRMLAAIKVQLNAPIRGGVYYSCLGRGQHMFGAPNRELGLIRDPGRSRWLDFLPTGKFPITAYMATPGY